jgi:hypothetical protein
MTMQPVQKQPRGWDFFLTTFLVFLLLVITGIFVAIGVSFGVATLGCSDAGAGCNTGAISLGSQIAVFGTSVVALGAIITSVVFIARRRVAFWVPALGILLVSGLYLLGAFLVAEAVPGG